MGKTKNFLKQGILALIFVSIGFLGGYIFFGEPAGNISLKPGADRITNMAEASSRAGIRVNTSPSMNPGLYTLWSLEPLNLGDFGLTKAAEGELPRNKDGRLRI